MSEPDPTIFDAILAGDIPCHRVYEDDHVLAFLDIAPLSRGHVLVIPKERARFMHELSEASAAALGAVLPKLCRAVMAATGCEHYNLLQNNGAPAHQAVLHVHVHTRMHALTYTVRRPTPTFCLSTVSADGSVNIH